MLVLRFRHLNIVACFALKKNYKGGGPRTLQEPPSYAPPWTPCYPLFNTSMGISSNVEIFKKKHKIGFPEKKTSQFFMVTHDVLITGEIKMISIKKLEH